MLDNHKDLFKLKLLASTMFNDWCSNPTSLISYFPSYKKKKKYEIILIIIFFFFCR